MSAGAQLREEGCFEVRSCQKESKGLKSEYYPLQRKLKHLQRNYIGSLACKEVEKHVEQSRESAPRFNQSCVQEITDKQPVNSPGSSETKQQRHYCELMHKKILPSRQRGAKGAGGFPACPVRTLCASTSPCQQLPAGCWCHCPALGPCVTNVT